MKLRSESSKRQYYISLGGLILITVFWGLGFPALKVIETIPTFAGMCVRFLSAAAVIALAFPQKMKLIDRDALKVGILAGAAMFITYMCATEGIKFTTSARTAFFSCLEGVCVPILELLVFRRLPGRKSILCILLCAAGVYMVSMGGSADFGMNYGDIISIGASVFFAVEIIMIERMMEDNDVFAVTAVEMGVIGAISGLACLITGERIPASTTGFQWLTLIFLSVCCSALAFILKVLAQRRVPAGQAALILTLEPVLGSMFSVLLLDETLGIWGVIGGIVIVLSIVISEYEFSGKKC